MAKNKVINTVLTLRDNMSGGLVKAAQNAKKSGAQIDDSMIKATRRVVAFKKKAVSSIKDAASEMGKLAVKMTKVGIAAGAATAAFAIKTGFAEAFDLEGYRLQLETATKDTQKAAEIMQYAIDLANRTPYEGGQLVEGAAKFESMGMAAKAWLTRAGDMAAATNKGYDQAVEALIDAQTGELERLKEFGITKAMILAKGEQLFTGVQIANNKGQIVNQEKFNDALIALMEDKFAGGMAKQATTVKGLWSTVTGVAKSALAELAGMTSKGVIREGSALDMLKGKVGALADRFAAWQQDGTLGRLATALDNGLAAALDKAGAAFEWLKTNVAPVARALGEAATEAFGWARENVLPKLEAALPVIANAFGWIAQNMDKVAPVLGTLIKLWVGGKVLKFGGDVISGASDLWEFGKATKEVAKNNLPKLLAGFKGGAGKIFGWLAAGSSKLGAGIAAVGGVIGKVIGSVAGVGKALLGLAAAHPVIAGIAIAATLIIANWDKIKPVLIALWNKAKEVFSAVRDWAVEKFGAIKDTAIRLFHSVKDTFGRIKSSIIGAFEGAKSKVMGFFSWLDDKIESIPLLGTLYKGGKAVAGGAADLIGGMVGRNALGTSYWRGGMTYVHERGGEILDLPGGTRVIPHDVSMRMAGAPHVTVNVTVVGNVIGNRQYADEMGATIVDNLLRALDNV